MHNHLFKILEQIVIPSVNKPLSAYQAIRNINEINDQIQIEIILPFPEKFIKSRLETAITDTLAKSFPVLNKKIEMTIGHQIEPRVVQHGLAGIPNVKNIIAVASGKGGVGKSTTAVNLALALSEAGARVGILDADIYGPNQPQMLGLKAQAEATDNQKLKPLIKYGIQAMSIGFLINQEDTPMVWRGPMVSAALQQLLNDTAWDNCDYLIIDLPPGTGDIQLTLAQKIPVAGAIVVTTPQDIALLDVKKAIRMFEKVNVPILGVVENMSVHICKKCGEQEFIFGSGGADALAHQYNFEILGHLPLDLTIRADVDNGRPTVVAHPESNITNSYSEIAIKIAAKLALQHKNTAIKFPKIVVEK